MANDIFLIGANDEHGLNPPTPGKRTPVVPGLNRQIYENEFNRAAKNFFIEALKKILVMKRKYAFFLHLAEPRWAVIILTIIMVWY